uniref:Uncharacterized protein n=1 Tax=Kalanchoe fedtschenkoi TaxID=63787 RepID=A0A7N0UPD6_KALFE
MELEVMTCDQALFFTNQVWFFLVSFGMKSSRVCVACKIKHEYDFMDAETKLSETTYRPDFFVYESLAGQEHVPCVEAASLHASSKSNQRAPTCR